MEIHLERKEDPVLTTTSARQAHEADPLFSQTPHINIRQIVVFSSTKRNPSKYDGDPACGAPLAPNVFLCDVSKSLFFIIKVASFSFKPTLGKLPRKLYRTYFTNDIATGPLVRYSSYTLSLLYHPKFLI